MASPHRFQGVELRAESARIGTADETVAVSKRFKESVIRPILKGHFKRDEFLGRIDEMLYFLPFSPTELRQLVALQMERWRRKAESRHGITLSWSDGLLDELAKDYDVHYGARSLQHAVDQRVVNQLAHGHEQGSVVPGGAVHISVGRDATIKLEATPPVETGSSWFG
jgi:ATP-dependent Clp protease ATP-binding subunit ClpB